MRYKNLLCWKLQCQLRLLRDDSRSEGFNENFDKAIRVAVDHLSDPKIFDNELPDFLIRSDPERLKPIYLGIKEDYESCKRDTDELVEIALTNSHIKETLARLLEAKSSAAAQARKEDEREHYFTLASGYDPNASPLELSDLRKLIRRTRKEIRRLRNQIADREALKIDLSLSQLGTLISIISTLFVITGYLYNYFLLRHFGIDVSLYFTLSDYLASSIEGLRYSAFGAVTGVISYFLGMHNTSRRSYADVRSQRKHYDNIWIAVIGISTAGVVVGITTGDFERAYDAGRLLIIFGTLRAAPWIAHRYFKEPLMATFLLVFIGNFFGYISTSVGKEIYRLEHKSAEELKRYDIVFKNPLPFDSANAVLLGANSGYLFMKDAKKAVYIIRRDQVDLLSVHHKQP